MGLYERALSPLKIGGVEIKNRVARAAHATMLADRGAITEALIAYHRARAEGGVGLTILEAAGVHASSLLSLANLDDSIVGGYQRLAAAIAPSGMRLFQQLWHGGHIYMQPDGSPPLAPSAVPSPIAGVAPRPMTVPEIDELVAAFAAAARRVERGGLDGVEIHAGHGYLLAQFLSPVLNRREDDYGGDIENRLRFLTRILEAVRDVVSPGFAVGVRLSDSADARILDMNSVGFVAHRLQDLGLVDYVNISYGDYYALHRQVGGMDVPAGFQLPFTAPPVADLRIPRLLNGRFRTLEEVEQVLRAGEADIVSMVRAHIADPDIVAKSIAGTPERVRPCLACNQGCIGRISTFGRLGCVVNTAAGDEGTLAETLIQQAQEPKTILVVGGGPAGMEAARIAATAGHRVVLAEAAPTLGGLMTLYRHAPRMGTIADITDWLEAEVYRLGVEVRLSTFMDADDITAEDADAVILALGAALDAPMQHVQMPAAPVGIEDGARIISSIDFFAEQSGGRGGSAIVIDDVGHYEAIACAEKLLLEGCKVTFLTRHKMFAPQIDIALRSERALERLHAAGDFSLRIGARLVTARRGVADILSSHAGGLEQIDADLIVWVGIRPGQDEIAKLLEARGFSPIRIGDMIAARNLQTAIREGHLAARALTPGAPGSNPIA